MKAPILLLAALPLLAAEQPPAPDKAPDAIRLAEHAPDWQDAECRPTENYLRDATRAALLAHADAMEQALAQAPETDEELQQALISVDMRSLAIAARAMVGVPSGHLPQPLREYLRQLFDYLQHPTGNPDTYSDEEAYSRFLSKELPEKDKELAAAQPGYGSLLGFRGTFYLWHNITYGLFRETSGIQDKSEAARRYIAGLRREAAAIRPVATQADARLELTRRRYACHDVCTLEAIAGTLEGPSSLLGLSAGDSVSFFCPTGPEDGSYGWQLAAPPAR